MPVHVIEFFIQAIPPTAVPDSSTLPKLARQVVSTIFCML